MEFTVEERLALLSLLPPEGTLLTMKIVHELRQGLAFSEKDFAILQFKQVDEQLKWEKGVGPKEVKVGVKATGIVYDLLAKLDKDGKLREAHLSLCEKFEYTGE